MSKQKRNTNSTSNRIYENIFQYDDTDLVKLITYAKLKKREQDFIEEYRKEHNCWDVPEEAYQTFYKTVGLVLNQSQSAGQHLVNQYFGSLESRIKMIEETLHDKPHSLENIHKKLHEKAFTPFFGLAFWQNIVASFIFILMSGAIIYLLNLATAEELGKAFRTWWKG